MKDYKSKVSLVLILFGATSLFYSVVVHSEVFNVTNEDELREALSIAESNGEDDVINLAAGLYQTFGEPFEYSSDEDFALIVEGVGASLTILDGGEINRVIDISTTLQGDSVISIKGLTIQNGGGVSSEGAGISVSALGGFAEILENKFQNNSTTGIGGGAYIRSNSLYMSNNQFIENNAGISGGGAFISTAHLNLSGNQFVGDSSKGEGGGLFMSGISNAVIINNIFAYNSCAGTFCEGGALFSELGYSGRPVNLTLTNNTFTMNYTDMFGSALVVNNVPSWAPNTINIYNNIAILNNAIDGSDILIKTFQLPIPTPPPPGVTPSPTIIDFGTVNLFNNDIAVYNLEIASECSFSDFYTCLIEINEDNNINEDPLFVDAEARDFSLQPNSPCIDSGDPNAPDVPDTDIFGNPRVPPPDMGAVEFIEEAITSRGGCSMIRTPVSSSLAVFLALPVLIIIRRLVKRYRSW